MSNSMGLREYTQTYLFRILGRSGDISGTVSLDPLRLCENTISECLVKTLKRVGGAAPSPVRRSPLGRRPLIGGSCV